MTMMLSKSTMETLLRQAFAEQQPDDLAVFWMHHASAVCWLDRAGLEQQMEVWNSACCALSDNNQTLRFEGRELHIAVVQQISERRMQQTQLDPMLLLMSSTAVTGYAYFFLDRAARDDLVRRLGGGEERSHACGACAAQPASLRVCGKCRVVRYCNADCQRAHWGKHRVLCIKDASLRASRSAQSP